MKNSAYILLTLLALLFACTKADLCEEGDHPHPAGVLFSFDWANDAKGLMTDGQDDNDSVLVLTKRIIGTWVRGFRVASTDGFGYYDINKPEPVFDDDGNPLPVEGIDNPINLFKVRTGLYKCIAINRDTTEFDYRAIENYIDDVETGTTLGDLCVEYKRYSSSSEKLRGAVAGWTDYNIYGGDANYLQPDMLPIYYDTIAPVAIDRGVQQQFHFKPVILTQNIDIRFHLRKKYQEDGVKFHVEEIFGGISGIPYRLNLSTGFFDTENTAKMMFKCELQDENGRPFVDSDDNEQPMVCHGNIDVLSLVNSPDAERLRGPGILQLMIRIKDQKTIRVKVNLHDVIARARLYEPVDDGNWGRLRKRSGVLEIDTDLVIDEKAVLPSEDGGMEIWVQAGKDDIIVDT